MENDSEKWTPIQSSNSSKIYPWIIWTEQYQTTKGIMFVEMCTDIMPAICIQKSRKNQYYITYSYV